LSCSELRGFLPCEIKVIYFLAFRVAMGDSGGVMQNEITCDLSFPSELVPCKKCGTQTEVMDLFPGKVCLCCHEKRFNAAVSKNGGILPRPDFSKVIA
jgi:hypothetical protein